MTEGAVAASRGGLIEAPEPAIVVERLVKRYGGRPVVDGVSLAVAPGELVALLGPNGAGKTTTVEIVEGYRRADAGTVRVLGADPSGSGREHRARVGLMLQAGGFDPRARPRETIEQFGRFHASPRPTGELVGLLGLDLVAGTPYRRLSGGERQRLSLAVALVGRPDVLVLDEPSAGMDPEARVVTRELVASERDRGAAILLTSHDLTEVERLADRIVVLDEGRIVAAGSPRELMAAVSPSVRVRLARPAGDPVIRAVAARLTALGQPDPIVEARATDLLVRGGPVEPAVVAAVAAGCADASALIVELRTTSDSLEDAYFAALEAHRASRQGSAS